MIVLLAACGGHAKSGISKTEYIPRANAICVKSRCPHSAGSAGAHDRADAGPRPARGPVWDQGVRREGLIGVTVADHRYSNA